MHADDLLAADFGEAEVGMDDSDIGGHRKLGGGYLYYWLDLVTGSNCWGGAVRDIPPKGPTPDGDSMNIPG